MAVGNPVRGLDVADVVLHLAQTDELAVGSATGRFESVVAAMAEEGSGWLRSTTEPP